MDQRVCNNSIRRFLGMKGKSRLGIKNNLTEHLLELKFPEITFIESKRVETDYGEWNEVYLLTRVKKVETPEYFRYITFQVDLIMRTLKQFGIKDCGIQEFQCDDNTYNILIYILSDGKEKESCRKSEFEEIFGELYY